MPVAVMTLQVGRGAVLTFVRFGLLLLPLGDHLLVVFGKGASLAHLHILDRFPTFRLHKCLRSTARGCQTRVKVHAHADIASV
eukprot:4123565-Pyramimonas_sp.AAC.1